MTDVFKALDDDASLGRAFRLLYEVTDADGDISAHWLKKEGMVAMPVESGFYFSPRDIETVSAAMEGIKSEKCLAILNERSISLTMCYEVAPTREGLVQFQEECSHFDYLLVPMDKKFAISCSTTGDHLVIGGPEPFVESALGKSLAEAREDFLAYARHEMWRRGKTWTPEGNAYLLSLLEKYTWP